MRRTPPPVEDPICNCLAIPETSLALSMNTREANFQRDRKWYRDLWADPQVAGTQFFLDRPGANLTGFMIDPAAIAAVFPNANPTVPGGFGQLTAFTNPDGSVWSDAGAGAAPVEGVRLPPDEARELAVRLVSLGGRHVDEATPCMDVRLGDGVRVKQMYFPQTAVLITRFMSSEGVGEVIDFMPVADEPTVATPNRLIVRAVRVVRGTLTFRLECRPRFDYGRSEHTATASERGVRFDDGIHFFARERREEVRLLGF